MAKIVLASGESHIFTFEALEDRQCLAETFIPLRQQAAGGGGGGGAAATVALATVALAAVALAAVALAAVALAAVVLAAVALAAVALAARAHQTVLLPLPRRRQPRADSPWASRTRSLTRSRCCAASR